MSEKDNEMVATPKVTMDMLSPGFAEIARELATPVIPTIQESVFVEKWLPLFSNIEDFERETIEDENTRRPIFMWVQEVSKNPNLPVHVCNGKDVLFEVPPVLADISFDFRERYPGYDLAAEVATAKKKAMILGSLGEEHFRDRIASVVLPEFTPTRKYAEAWNSIFARYNMPLMNLDSRPQVVEPAVQQQTSSTFDDEQVEEL